MNWNHIVIFISIIFLLSCNSEVISVNKLDIKDSDKVFILIRHAEKQTGENPSLTTEGLERANKLSHVLSQFQIDKIYTSDFKRTRETIYPISNELMLQPQVYNHKSLKNFSNLLLRNSPGIYLISGHSNSTPSLSNLLCSCDYYKTIDETDFTNIFVVIISQNGENRTLNFRY